MPERRQPAFAGHAPDAHRRAADVHGLGRLQFADHKGDQVGGHGDGVGEADHLPAVLQLFGADGGVGHRGQIRIDDQDGGEDGLERRLVPAREGPAGIGRLKLCGGEEAEVARGVLVLAAVKAAELVVESALEREAKPPDAGGEGLGEGKTAALGRLVERDGGGLRDPRRTFRRRTGDAQLGRVEEDLRGRLVDGHRNGFFTRKRSGREVRLEAEVITSRDDVSRQPIRVHVLVSSGHRCALGSKLG